jgi:DNA-binding MarR family transcriptional regulator
MFSDQEYQDQADFRAALRRFLRFSEDQCRNQGITPQQQQLLLAVRGHAEYPGVTIGQVAEALQIRHHSASLLVDRTVKRGLLERREDPDDRRRALLRLLPEGQRILDAVMEANRQQLVSLRGSLFRDSLLQVLSSYDATMERVAK